jgi:hypothetical protein
MNGRATNNDRELLNEFAWVLGLPCLRLPRPPLHQTVRGRVSVSWPHFSLLRSYIKESWIYLGAKVRAWGSETPLDLLIISCRFRLRRSRGIRIVPFRKPSGGELKDWQR